MTERIAGSMALVAISRVAVPLLLAIACGSVPWLLHLDHRITVIEQQRPAIPDEVTRRLGALEISDQRDREVMTQLRTDVASLLAQQSATLRTLDRIERALDRRAP